MNTYKCDNCGHWIDVESDDENGVLETASINVTSYGGLVDWYDNVPHNFICNINERQRDGH